MVGVYEAHETVVDFGELVVVEGGRELGCFGESERFVTKDGERSIGVSCLMVYIGESAYLSVT